jgi:hypothetical protein
MITKKDLLIRIKGLERTVWPLDCPAKFKFGDIVKLAEPDADEMGRFHIGDEGDTFEILKAEALNTYDTFYWAYTIKGKNQIYERIPQYYFEAL